MRFSFYSSLSYCPWGGSEELWGRTAMYLASNGHSVTASVKKWPTPAWQIQKLRQAGVSLTERDESSPPLFERIAQKILQRAGCQNPFSTQTKLQDYFHELAPQLVIISQGHISDGLPAMEAARDSGLPYVVIVQANSESWWPSDDMADRMIAAYTPAQKVYFVAEANRILFCRQVGREFQNSIVVCNPAHATVIKPLEWPNLDTELSLACVARLDPIAKGQDLLLEVLAQPQWKERSVSLYLYGTGMNERSLRRQAKTLGIEDKIYFVGHAENIAQVWSQHHALVLSSRYEGTPLSLIEAMRCGRPAICTEVGGMPELVEDGQTGFLASAPTETHIARVLEHVWETRHQLQSMGEAASKSIAAKLPGDPIKTFAVELMQLISTNEDFNNSMGLIQ
ncbi:glycosyltransferase family 4 protein [Nodosilinea sp. FACHB-13]|uniref:glycosyltransferase family 4 protein n=1 Tax=Cyanophyceae TaxID=3028117 RepID=UPI00168376F9|nr:glycosyltransferase family 4 protein [Nodosilinea sp. FACHB-13]MBD2107740.1 glycosyltransferase family 4 protein [Nodosilinea sp. FACHB-13]